MTAAQQNAQAQCDRWNAAHPVGTKVMVKLDDQSQLQTATRSAAWVMGGHTAMIMVHGIAGGYRLDRVSARA